MTSPNPDFLPKPDPQKKERAIQDSLRLYRQQAYGEAPVSSWTARLASWKPFASGMVMASLILGLICLHASAPAPVPPSANTVAELALLREMKQVFGAQLAAVVQDGNTIEPVISASAEYTDSQPVVITLRQGNKLIRIISFSGNTVILKLGQQNVSFSPIVTSDGKVIVEGKDFIWSHGKATGNAPGSIDARALGAAL